MPGILRRREGSNLVHFPRADKHSFRVNDSIPESGIYLALHGDHRLSHEVTLLAGGQFPRCNKCGDLVSFELVKAAPESIADRDFRIHLYEIPHPELPVEGIAGNVA